MLQQDPVWAELQVTLGLSVLWIGVIDRKGDLLAYAQVFVRKLPFGLTWWHCPRGPLFLRWTAEIEAPLFRKIEELADESGAIFVRFDWPEGFELPIVGSKLRRAHTTNFPETTLMLNLRLNEEELFAQMKPKGRYNIRLSKKHGITVRETTEPAAAQIFYDLLQKTTARDGFVGHSLEYYQNFLKILGEHSLASCFIAEKDGQPIAATLVTFFGDPAANPGRTTVTYYYGASDHEFRALMAPYALQWAAIQTAKARGFRRYDLLGIAPEKADERHPLMGVTDFKKKFGGRVINYKKSAEMVLRPILYILIKVIKQIRG